jgi:hypothetical protein
MPDPQNTATLDPDQRICHDAQIAGAEPTDLYIVRYSLY